MTQDRPDADVARDPLNSQITAAVAFANATAASNSPVVAHAALQQAIVHSASLAMLNAVAAQQSAYVSASAVVAATTSRILRTREAQKAP